MEEEQEAVEEDDGLGFYEDGTKRTLTDEQVAIFRHSEIETLLRERRHAKEAEEDCYQDDSRKPASDDRGFADGMQSEREIREARMPQNGHDASLKSSSNEVLEDGELDEESPYAEQYSSTPTNNEKSQPKKKKRKGKKQQLTGMKGGNGNHDNHDRSDQGGGYYKRNIKPDLRKRTWDKVETGLEGLDYDEGASASQPAHTAQRRKITYDDD